MFRDLGTEYGGRSRNIERTRTPIVPDHCQGGWGACTPRQPAPWAGGPSPLWAVGEMLRVTGTWGPTEPLSQRAWWEGVRTGQAGR